MRMPNCEQAYVDIVKIRDYCLSPTHPRGRHKSRVFAASLGLSQADEKEFRKALLGAACNEDAMLGELDAYGQRYVIDFRMSTATGEATIRSVWIIRNDEEHPRLLTCYVR
jgi:hypothetical protein